MLDIKIIRNDPEAVKKAVGSRGANMDEVIDEVLRCDEVRRKTLAEVESMKSMQNAVSKKIPVMKKNGEDTSAVMSEMKELSDKISEKNKELSELEKAQRELILTIPNIPNKDVPIGKDDSENVEIRRWGEPRKFEFEAKAHWDIGKNLDILDPERAAKVTGARFHFYKGLGAKLERSVINFFLNTHTENGYKEILPPYIVNSDSLYGTGQFPKFKEDEFKLENTDYYLIPTAEVPVTNYHRDEILDGDKLPIKYCAYSACFRSGMAFF